MAENENSVSLGTARLLMREFPGGSAMLSIVTERQILCVEISQSGLMLARHNAVEARANSKGFRIVEPTQKRKKLAHNAN